MSKTIRVNDIKWAYTKELKGNLVKDFFDCLGLFVCEIIRSDEIGLVVFSNQPVFMVRIPEVDFESEKIYAEVMNFKDSHLEDFFLEVKSMLVDNCPRIHCSGIEIFCYRPKPDMPYHPYIHPTYIRARENSCRILNAIFVTCVSSELPNSVGFAQVSAKTFKNFFKDSKNGKTHQKQIMRLVESIDTWISEFYTDEIGSKQYKTMNRYPLSPKPLEGARLYVITTDENGNFMAYERDV